MNTVVCTLFEGDYHFGVAALANSLTQHGFKGDMFVGFRGTLPVWVKNKDSVHAEKWPGSKSLDLPGGMNVHFLPVETQYHLTNYKPNFMLELMEGLASKSMGIIYFDPDIVVKCDWAFFENWITHGVGVVHEIINNDMPPSHPIRREWEKVICRSGLKKSRELYTYINGGFCGVSRENLDFLNEWKTIFDTGIKYFELTPDQWAHARNRTYVFAAQDQDALNITAMCSSRPISEMGPDAMDFIPGGWTMSHAVGSPKPWEKNFLIESFGGKGPTIADRQFWQYANRPIRCYSNLQVRQKKIAMAFAGFLGRFYHRN